MYSSSDLYREVCKYVNVAPLLSFHADSTGVAASIWLEKGYDNTPYFIAFALFCLSATLFTAADLRYVLVQYRE